VARSSQVTRGVLFMIDKRILRKLLVPPGRRVDVGDYGTTWRHIPGLARMGEPAMKKRAAALLAMSQARLSKAQEMLYADDRHAVLIVLQAMDAAGKDGTIRHVMSGVNPQGCQVYSFKKPSTEELDHTFLWRCMKSLPERGRIGIFNRSYYEDVLVVKVHEDWLDNEPLTTRKYDRKFWRQRYDDINAFEHHLVRNGTVILKFFLHVSKAEQKKRFLARLEDPRKYWKFSAGDVAERQYWKQYMNAYSDAFSATSTAWAPWYIIPADAKWTARAIIADIIATTIHSLDLKYPRISRETRQALKIGRRQLERE
jgi:PPK2 family polyphosphate:nucleotide phosphotransferase